jgi:hypothetical protein
MIASQVKQSRTLKVLDLSFNCAGEASRKVKVRQPDKTVFECSEAAWRWRKAVQRNRSLLHLDISHNGFTKVDMETIGDGLRENHTLLGLHALGVARTDHNGFIKTVEDDEVF